MLPPLWLSLSRGLLLKSMGPSPSGLELCVGVDIWGNGGMEGPSCFTPRLVAAGKAVALAKASV